MKRDSPVLPNLAVLTNILTIRLNNCVTFINHATVLIELNGFRILTDPFYSFFVSYFLPRFQRPGVPFEQLPPIDLVAISHDHYDHLNLKTLRRIRRRYDPIFMCPKGLGKFASRLGFSESHELQWWEKYEHGQVSITCVPAKHFSGRTPFDRKGSLPGGFVFESGGKSVYFAGDTAYDSFFVELRRRFSLDIALLPIGAYKPHTWFRGIHLNPESAIQAFLDSAAKVLVPIHWGTFKISDEPMSEPPKLLLREASARGIAEKVKVLKNGARWEF